MIEWLNAHAGIAIWLVAVWLGVSLAVVFVHARRARLTRERAVLCAALHPIRTLCDDVRVLREAMEQSNGRARLGEVTLLIDGSLAQRLRDVRGLAVQDLPTSRAIEATYEAKAAAARLIVWLERSGGDPIERRLSVQMIWKTLHDATGSLERDLSRIESSAGAGKRRF